MAAEPRIHPDARKPTGRGTITVWSMALLMSAAVVTSLRGLPNMAKEELTMFWYIGFAVLLFLIPAALVSAELGGAFGRRKGGVYLWIGEAFGKRWGFLALWLQRVRNVVWYPTGLAFAAAAVAFVFGDAALAGNNVFVGLFCIASYWLATRIALSGTDLLVKVAKYGFVLGTIVPGLVLLGLAVYWIASGQPIGWEAAHSTQVEVHGHPRFFPYIDGLATLSFLASILLLFAGVESQAVHVNEMDNPRSGFPTAMLLAALLSAGIFTIGSLALAAILTYDEINLQSGVFTGLEKSLTHLGTPWLVPVLAVLIGYGALGGALAWISGPSKGLLATAKDGMLPPLLQRTNKKGIQRNILIVQGVIVTLISSVYLFMKDVSAAFFLISAMTVSLYIIMYLMLYAAAIYLRYTRPDLDRKFKVPGGIAGMWTVAGIGFAAVAFALVLSFVPPAQLTFGSPAAYVAIVAAGIVVFGGIPLLITRFRRASWAREVPHVEKD
ncbi:amino acid permease [Nocardiopsis coralliicola]